MKRTLNPLQDQDKDNRFLSQLQKVYNSFFQSPKTMKEADFDCGVMRESICRYCATLRKEGRLFEIEKRDCKITGHRATVFTSNPELVPPSNQLQLDL